MPRRYGTRWAGLLLLVVCAGVSPLAARSEPPATQDPDVVSRQRGEAYTHLMRSLLAARRGEFESALTEIRSALDLQPDSPDLLIEAADLLLWTGRRSEAERLARRALTLEPEHHDAMRFLADLAMARALGSEKDAKSREEALRLFEKLSEGDDPVDAHVLRMLVQLRVQAGDYRGAVRAAQRIVKDRPGDAKAATTLAQLLLQLGEESEALRVLLEHVAEHPFEQELLGFTERLAQNLEAWPAVVDVLAPRAPFSSEFPAIQRFLGEALLRSGRTAEATTALERVAQTHPEDLQTRKYLALAYRGVGRMADAKTLLASLIDDSPGQPSFQQLLGEILELQGDAQGALANYETALGGMGTDDRARAVRDGVRLRMARLHTDLEEFAKARSVLDELEQPEATAALRLEAQLAILTRDWAAARRISRQLKSAGEEGPSAMLEGEIAVHEKRWSKAGSKFAEAIELLGPYTRGAVAEIYRLGGRPESGSVLLRDWVEAAPEHADARYLLGEFLYRLGRYDEAEPQLRRAFELQPQHAAALNFLGYSLAERNTRLEEALEMILRALEIDGWNGAYLDSLGWVYYQMGRYDEARAPLERAARELPGDATVLEHLGDLYLRLGERELALAAWQRALDSGPDNAEGLRRKIDQERLVSDSTRAYSQPSDGETGVEERLEASSQTPPP